LGFNLGGKMIFSKKCITKLQSKIVLKDIIDDYIQVHKLSRNFDIATCPFCDDPDASFIVPRKHDHCFCTECGFHGDAVDFLMTKLRISFEEVIKLLAKRYSVPLEKATKADRGSSREKLEILLKAVMDTQ
jgi:DNA primase